MTIEDEETTPDERVADALREAARKLDHEFDIGKRKQHIDLFTLVETLLAIADRLDPPLT